MTKLMQMVTLSVAVGFAFAGCSTNAPQTAAEAGSSPQHKSELQFVDLGAFDRDLAGSLSANLPKVDVEFFDRTSPNAMPERMQTWIASVEGGGGTVRIIPPKSSVSAKSPLLLIGALSTLWSAYKTTKEVSTQAQFRSAKSYDAEIQLKADDKGGTVVDRIVFTQRK